MQSFELRDVATEMPAAVVSHANAGLVARDLADTSGRDRLAALTADRLVEICRDAAERFLAGDLPIDPTDGTVQSPEDYVRQLSSTTGMPHALVRANMEKIRFVLAEAPTVLAGLTRGLDLGVLDRGYGEQDGRTVSYLAQADRLGVILPSNSPGVHSLWIPSIPLKVPLALKPGRQEPWTPLRICQALIAAGAPREAFGLYPTDHGGANEILLRCGRSMLFGDASTVGAWSEDPRVQLHGPGWSKVLFGADAATAFEDHLDLLVTSVAGNGGRSCVNASGVWTPSRGEELAAALAARLARIEPLPLDDPDAGIAAFSDPIVAHRISEHIDRALAGGGAVDLTARVRGGERVVEVGGCTFLRPTVVWCEDPGHPLAAAEYLFPFASVVQVPEEEMPDRIGPTLVASVIGGDERFRARLLRSRSIDRLNLGSIPTSRVCWDQPHEGNLFEHLYRQRALQSVG